MDAPPVLSVSVPRSALPLDGRHQELLSRHTFAWLLRTVLSERLGMLVVAQTTDGTRYEIDPGSTPAHPIAIATLAQIDRAVDELLAAPEVWRHSHRWAPSWEAPDPWEPWYQTGTARWGDESIPFDIKIHREPFALLVGYWTDGEPKRKWYRVRFPAEHPSADAIGHAIMRSVSVWLEARWPQGPEGTN
jgi:hypothetical protein